jgi:hypothetical protein
MAERGIVADIEATPSSPAIVSLSPKTIFILLVGISVALVAISFIGVVVLSPYAGNPYTGDPSATPTSLSKLVLRLDVMQEGNVPSWYSGAILFIASGLLALIAADKYTQRDRFRWHWIVLSVLFLLFSLDEIAYLHEGVNNFMSQSSSGVMRIGWIVPAAVFVIIVGLWYIPFILKLPTRTRTLVIASAALFLGGALLLEIGDNFLLENYEVMSPIVLTSNHLQDLLEMIGVSLFIYTLLSYIRSYMNPLRLVVR